MRFHFDCVFYYVSDLDRAVRFYQDVLELKLTSRDVVARFHLDGVLVELVPRKEGALEGNGNARLTLRVADIEAAAANLRVKGVAVSAPQPKANGVLATLRDPDGNEICLWQYSTP
ncbi:MAG TPA: VOC family protein [Terriglobales bacterium]|nr:VOC family protein [Terriglobales bacterium]